MIFEQFIKNNSSKLARGERVLLPIWFKNLSQIGFTEESFSQPVGQIKDYVLSNKDGSRFHVHEFEDGSLVIHLDKFDPNKDLSSLIKHLIQETWIAPLVLAFLGLIFLAQSE